MRFELPGVARVLGVEGAGHARARYCMAGGVASRCRCCAAAADDVTRPARGLVLLAKQPDDHGEAAKALLEWHPKPAPGALLIALCTPQKNKSKTEAKQKQAQPAYGWLVQYMVLQCDNVLVVAFTIGKT